MQNLQAQRFARIAVDSEQDESAARLLAFAASLRRTHGIAGSLRERHEIVRLSQILDKRMDRATHEHAVREGRAMALDTAVHRALTEGKAATPENADSLILA